MTEWPINSLIINLMLLFIHPKSLHDYAKILRNQDLRKKKKRNDWMFSNGPVWGGILLRWVRTPGSWSPDGRCWPLTAGRMNYLSLTMTSRWRRPHSGGRAPAAPTPPVTPAKPATAPAISMTTAPYVHRPFSSICKQKEQTKQIYPVRSVRAFNSE